MKNIIIFITLLFLIAGISADENKIPYEITKINNDQYSLDINLINLEFDTIIIFARVKGKYKEIGQIEKIDGDIPLYFTLPLKNNPKNIEIVCINKTSLYSEKVKYKKEKSRRLERLERLAKLKVER